MRFRDPLARYFDQVSSSFDAIYTGRKSLVGQVWDQWTRQNIQYRFDFAMQAVAPVSGKRILDVGCGSGRYGVELAARGAKQVVGLDISSQMIALAKRLAKQSDSEERCLFLHRDILEYRDEELFNHVLAIGFFDYILDPAPVFAHIRALATGSLVASFPYRYAFRAPVRKLWLMFHGCPVRFFTAGEIRRLCSDAGFRCLTLSCRGPIYLLIAELA